MKNKLLILLIVSFIFGLLGCQTTTTYYLGAQAEPDEVVSLSPWNAGPQHWQDLYVEVDYYLTFDGEQLDIEGTLSFSDSPQVNYTRVMDLKLKVFLLDKDLTVVSYRDIARTLSGQLEDETDFRGVLPFPNSAQFLTFGYDGSFEDNDPESPSTDSIWKLPARQK